MDPNQKNYSSSQDQESGTTVNEINYNFNLKSGNENVFNSVESRGQKGGITTNRLNIFSKNQNKRKPSGKIILKVVSALIAIAAGIVAILTYFGV